MDGRTTTELAYARARARNRAQGAQHELRPTIIILNILRTNTVRLINYTLTTVNVVADDFADDPCHCAVRGAKPGGGSTMSWVQKIPNVAL